MDSSQAKKILALYRPDTADADDPEVAEALEQARRDPDLGRWFADHCAFQKVVRAKLRETPVPDGLKERILAGERPRVIVWWKRPEVLAAAAAVVVLITLSGWWFGGRPETGFPAYRDRMVRHALRVYRMDLVTNDLNRIREFLVRQNGHGDYVLAKGLEKLPGEGCALLSWQGQRVSMICFDRGNNDELYLFVINRSALPNAPRAEKPEFARVNKLMTASWSMGDKTYVLAGQGDQEFLRQYF